MACYHPLRAYKTASGEVVFNERSTHDIYAQLSLPCGQCIGCRLERSRQWAMRCMHEASLYESNCFVTLTYSDQFLPERGQLDYSAFQKFLKRLRKRAGSPVRFYMCGEYGSVNWRPHYHACLFNVDFGDKTYWSTGGSGEKIYRSAELEKLWPFGASSVGAVTFESAAYVARYCVQKVTGHNAKLHYARIDGDGPYSLVPEFNHMSLKPGIGAPWLARWKTDVYPHDYVIVNGVQVKPPKYYDKIFAKESPEDFEEMQFRRECTGRSRYDDNTMERLAVKEIVTRAKVNQLFRSEI